MSQTDAVFYGGAIFGSFVTLIVVIMLLFVVGDDKGRRP